MSVGRYAFASSYSVAKIAVFLVLIPTEGRAQPISMIVHRAESASSCPDSSAVAESVNRLVGRQALLPGASPSGIEIEVRKTEEGHVAHVRFLGEHGGERTILDRDSVSCQGLTDALSLALSLFLDGLGERQARPLAPPPQYPQPKAPAVLGNPVASWRISWGPSLTTGMPHGWGSGSLAGITYEKAGVAIGTRWLWTPSEELQYSPGTVRISQQSLLLQACARLAGENETVEIQLCGWPFVSRLKGEGVGFSKNWSGTRPWYGLGFGVNARGSIGGPIGWWATTGLNLPLNQESFSIEGVGIAYRTQNLAFLGSFGVDLKIW